MNPDDRNLEQQDLAAWLRARREQAGLDEEALCARTKIHPKFIRALESGEWNALPSRTHLRSFAIAYAKACDADPQRAAELAAKALGRPAPPAPAPATPDSPPRLRYQASDTPVQAPRVAVPRPFDDPGESRWGLWAGMALGVALVLWVLTRLVPAPHSGKALPDSSARQPAAQAEAADPDPDPQATAQPTRRPTARPTARPVIPAAAPGAMEAEDSEAEISTGPLGEGAPGLLARGFGGWKTPSRGHPGQRGKEGLVLPPGVAHAGGQRGRGESLVARGFAGLAGRTG